MGISRLRSHPSSDVLVEQMKSNFQSNSRSSTPAQSFTANSTPSVPISVYRELAAELQATRAMVDSLNNKNHHLDRENQVLRQEMHRVVQSVMTLQPWVMPIDTQTQTTDMRQRGSQTGATATPSWEETAAASAIAAKLRTPNDPSLTDQVTEVSATPHQVTQMKKAGGLGGLWLTLTILVIIVTAFGAGFLIMKPFLPTAK